MQELSRSSCNDCDTFAVCIHLNAPTHLMYIPLCCHVLLYLYIELVIPPMETNPTYANNNDNDGTYETIANIRELAPIKNLSPLPSDIKYEPAPHPLAMSYAHHDTNGVPHLPPPRMGPDYMGVAYSHQPLPPLEVPPPPKEDEYIEMSSRSLTSPSPRYIPGPVPAASPCRGGLDPVHELPPLPQSYIGPGFTNGFHFEPNQ